MQIIPFQSTSPQNFSIINESNMPIALPNKLNEILNDNHLSDKESRPTLTSMPQTSASNAASNIDQRLQAVPTPLFNL